jgi:hypothetical protein
MSTPGVPKVLAEMGPMSTPGVPKVSAEMGFGCNKHGTGSCTILRSQDDQNASLAWEFVSQLGFQFEQTVFITKGSTRVLAFIISGRRQRLGQRDTKRKYIHVGLNFVSCCCILVFVIILGCCCCNIIPPIIITLLFGTPGMPAKRVGCWGVLKKAIV